MADLVRSGRTPEELARRVRADRPVDFQLGERLPSETPASALMGRQALSGRNWGAFDVRTIACVRSATSLAKAAAWFARESKASPNGFTGSWASAPGHVSPFAPWPGS